jgi:hypothetical protein
MRPHYLSVEGGVDRSSGVSDQQPFGPFGRFWSAGFARSVMHPSSEWFLRVNVGSDGCLRSSCYEREALIHILA